MYFAALLALTRPYLTTMLNLILLIFGIFYFQNLPIDTLPNVEQPYIFVEVDYPNASAKVLENILLRPIEKNLKNLSGLKTMKGKAKNDYVSVELEFHYKTSMNQAMTDVKEAMGQMWLPKEASRPRIYHSKSNSSSALGFYISAPTTPLLELSKGVGQKLKTTLETIPGVGLISLWGTESEEVKLTFNPFKLAGQQISASHLTSQIKNNIARYPAGNWRQGEKSYKVLSDNQPQTLLELKNMPISLEGGAFVRLSEIVDIARTNMEKYSISEIDGVPILHIDISKQNNANLVQVSDDVQEKIKKFSQNLGNKVQILLDYDGAEFIRNSLISVGWDVLFGSILSVLIVFLFLRHALSALISAVVIPLSLISSCTFIALMGFTLNWVTAIALTLSIGLIVDDAIVIIENIHRHQKMNKSIKNAIIDATREIGFPAIAIALAVCSVFIPVAFIEGVIGRYFYEFGMSIVITVIISLIVTFTIVPLMYAQLEEKMESLKVPTFALRFLSFTERFQTLINFCLEKYLTFLKLCLKYKKLTLLAALLILILSIIGQKLLPQNYIEESDSDKVIMSLKFPTGTAFEHVEKRGRFVSKSIGRLPGVEHVILNANRGNSRATFDIKLLPKNKRTFKSKEFSDYVREKLKKEIHPSESWTDSDALDAWSSMKVIFVSDNFVKLNQNSESLMSFLKSLNDKNIKEVATSVDNLYQEILIKPDPLRCADLGISSVEVSQFIQTYFSGYKIDEMEIDGERLEIRLSSELTYLQSKSQIAEIPFVSSRGKTIYLGSVADIEERSTESSIRHYNGERQLSVNINYSGEDLGGFSERIKKYLNENIPTDVSYHIKGNAENIDKMNKIYTKTILASCLFLFIILCAQFESLLAAIAILVSVPLCFSGSFIALIVAQYSFTLYVFIGIILLIGLVAKNGILMSEFSLQRWRKGSGISEAVIEAGNIRFKPIIMTSLAMMFGMLPLILSTGEGHESLAPMAAAVIGGLFSSTLLSLVVIPCFLVWVIETFSIKAYSKT